MRQAHFNPPSYIGPKNPTPHPANTQAEYLETVDVDNSRRNLNVEHGEHGGGRLAGELRIQPRVQPGTVVALDHRAQGGAEERVGLGVLQETEQAEGGGGVIDGREGRPGGDEGDVLFPPRSVQSRAKGKRWMEIAAVTDLGVVRRFEMRRHAVLL